MPPVKTQKKVRPSTASGALESHEFVDLLDELRPATAPGKNLLGLDPTYVTSRHHVPGVPITSKIRGRQIFGGIPENDFKGSQGRRATLGGVEDVEEHEKPKRPATAVGVSKQIKVNCISIYHERRSMLRVRMLKFDLSRLRTEQCYNEKTFDVCLRVSVYDCGCFHDAHSLFHTLHLCKGIILSLWPFPTRWFDGFKKTTSIRCLHALFL